MINRYNRESFIYVAIFTVFLIVFVDLGLGYFLFNAEIADKRTTYKNCGWPIAEVTAEIAPLDGRPYEHHSDPTPTPFPTRKVYATGVIEEKDEDGHTVRWTKTTLRKSSTITTLVAVDVALAGAGYLLFLIFASYETRDSRKVATMVGVLATYIVISGSILVAMFNYFRFKPIEVENTTEFNAPIIYLYDDQSREVSVKLDINGELTHTYPSYDKDTGWNVKTSPDGTLTDANGRKYEYLFWEANGSLQADLSTGFCVKGEDSAEFLEKALSDLGLSDTEADTFIMYWLPQLEENPYNVITFQTTAYENEVRLDVSPAPDTIVRVNMAYYGTSEYVEMEPQDLKSMNPSLEDREGLILVEWGGEKLA